jgi:hypothetical protein
MEDLVSQPKQKNPWRLLTQQLRFAQRRLASSFVEMVGALPRRPEPAHVWHNVASPGRVAVKGFDAVVAGWIAMNAAVATGSIAIIDETAHRVERFFDDMKAVALSPYYAHSRGEISMTDARVRASKETTEAIHAILTSGLAANDACPLTIREIDEAIGALSELRASMVVVANHEPLNRRAQMVLS